MERPLFYTLDADGNPVPCFDADAWELWFTTANRHVAQDMDEGEGAERVHVSTVFLGLDQNHRADGDPILWETVVFGGALDRETRKYSSLRAAFEGHQAMCQAVRDARS